MELFVFMAHTAPCPVVPLIPVTSIRVASTTDEVTVFLIEVSNRYFSHGRNRTLALQ